MRRVCFHCREAGGHTTATTCRPLRWDAALWTCVLMIQPILRVQVQGRGVHSLQSATRAWDWVKNRMMLSQGPQSTAQDCLRIPRNFTVNFMKLHNCTVQTWPQLQRSDWRRGAAAARQLGRAIRLCFISLIKPSEEEEEECFEWKCKF